jgi:AbrB family transcriptional regulator, transcriptional pleiotropic regulator of transition state genes
LNPTGVTRRVDRLGRVVLPVEMRRTFGIQEGDLVEISVTGDAIVLAKVQDSCVFCTATTGLVQHAGRHVCGACATEIAHRTA